MIKRSSGSITKKGACVGSTSQAIAFDLDAVSSGCIRDTLPDWKFSEMKGATAASLAQKWNPGLASLLVLGARHNIVETLSLCRFLAFCRTCSRDFNREVEARYPRSPILVLLFPGQELLVEALMRAGADKCLTLPIHSGGVIDTLIGTEEGGVSEGNKVTSQPMPIEEARQGARLGQEPADQFSPACRSGLSETGVRGKDPLRLICGSVTSSCVQHRID